MEELNQEEVDLKQIFYLFWNKKWLIILIILIFVVLGVVYTEMIVKAEYKSSTTLVLAKMGVGEGNTITQTEITLNQKLVSTYSHLIKSKTLLLEVLNNLNIPESEEEKIRNQITVESVRDTEVIRITVINEDNIKAAAIANELPNAFSKKVAEIYNINNVHILDKAEAASEPYNISQTKTVLFFAAIGFVMAIIVTLFLNIFDTTVKSIEDIEKTTGLVVLAQIPDFDTELGGKKK